MKNQEAPMLESLMHTTQMQGRKVSASPNGDTRSCTLDFTYTNIKFADMATKEFSKATSRSVHNEKIIDIWDEGLS